MQINSNNKLIYCFLILILICLISCQEKVQVNDECSKFKHEEYLDEQLDSLLVKEALNFRDTLLNWFNETSIKGLNYSAYHLQTYSSHGYGKSIKFEKKDSSYFLRVNCIKEKEWLPDCKNYQIKISEEEWNKFEDMIYEFDFWTDKQFKSNKGVLDGFVFFLEGNRPKASICNKKTYRVIGRGSPEYDKMGALSSYIHDYENQLALRYRKREVKF